MRPLKIDHRFVTEVPAELESNVVFVSIPYATAVHLCPGCERKVVTPFAPGSWHLIFNGETVSIYPSIRNRAHTCRSHYWISHDRIVPAGAIETPGSPHPAPLHRSGAPSFEPDIRRNEPEHRLRRLLERFRGAIARHRQ